MTCIFTVCRDESHRNDRTCGDSRCCRTDQITAADRERYSSASLPRGEAVDDNSGNTTQIRPKRPLDGAFRPPLQCCQRIVGANAACAWAAEKFPRHGSESPAEACRVFP